MAALPPIKRTTSGMPGTHPMTENEHKECNAIMDAVYAAKEGPRLIATDFHALPDRKRYPDYYEAIPEPVCLDEVENKLDQKEFSSAQAFIVDLQLVFQNAMHYNEDDSSIWKDAKRLDDLVQELYATAEEEGILPPKNPSMVGPNASAGTSPVRGEVATSPSARTGGGADPSSSVPPVSPASGTPLTLAMLPKKRGRPTKEEAAVRAAAGYVKKPPRIKTKPAGQPQSDREGSLAASAGGRGTPKGTHAALPIPLAAAGAAAQASTPTPAATGVASVVPSKPIDVSIPWETYIPPSPSKMSEPNLSDQEESSAAFYGATAALDERLHRAEGFEVDGGWWETDGGPEAYDEVLGKLKHFVDASGRRLAEALEAVPMPTDNELLSFQGPLSLELVESRVSAAEYMTSDAFDKDMTRLFEKARRWHAEGSGPYGDILILQRYYQDLTSPNPGSTTAATGFSSLLGGPGNARRPLFPGSADTIATFRMSAKDRTYVDVGHSKGMSFVTGDYVHVSNADEPAKPIVGQVFKVFKPTKGAYVGQTSVSVCWYFRPEGTIHPASRLFWDNEILKTGYFGDHVLADVLEKVGAQFYSKAIRGRPKPPHWYPGWPLYVVESRYNPKERQMIKIKNWASCIPEELRKTDFMPIAPFPTILSLPKQISPFLRGVTGPGCLGYPETRKRPAGEGDSSDGEGKSEAVERATPVRSHKKRKPAAEPLGPSGLGFSTGAGTPNASGSATPSILAQQQQQQQAGGNYGSQRPSPALSRRPSAVPGSMSAPLMPPYAGAGGNAPRPYPSHPQQQQQQPIASGSRPSQQQQGGDPPRKMLDRSVIGNAGGPLWVSKTSAQAVVPPETAARFPSDPATGSLLWFSGPPMHVPPPIQPAHSPAYLAHLAALRNADAPPPSGSEPLDPILSEAMGSVLLPDPTLKAHEAFAYEFDGLTESEEWLAVMSV